MKKWWVKLLVGVAVVLLAFSILFFKSGSDSKKLVEQYRARLLAAGESLNPDDFIPPRTDADKNGAELFRQAAGFFAPRGASAIATNPPVPMNFVASGKASVAWQQSEMVGWIRGKIVTNSWAEVERDLVNQDNAMGILRQAAERPVFDFELNYRQIPIPTDHLSQMRDAVSLLSSQVIFNLHSGDVATAATNLETLLAVANADRNEPMGGSQTTRINLIQKALAVQWEWLLATNVTDEQLAMLQARWTNVDVVAPIEKAMRMTRFTTSEYMNLTRRGGPFSTVSVFSGNRFPAFFESIRQGAGDVLWRESWSYDDELNMLETYQVMIETVRQARTNDYFKDALAERERKIAAFGLNETNINWLRVGLDVRHPQNKAVITRAYANQVDRLAATEAMQQCAIAAIALKRHQLRHGTLPQELSALVPEFLPQVLRDPIDGKPLRYRLNADGTFVLYSIGVDGVDNGGDATPVPPATSLWWEIAHDWVWPQPATPLEIQHYYDHPPK